MDRRFYSALLAVGVLLPPAALPQTPKANGKGPALPEGTQAHRDLRYGPHEERNTLDLYVPKSDEPLPLVVWVHGGGWQNGSKDGANNPALPLLKKGYAVAAINYRLSQHAVFPAQIEDCKAAVRFLRANAGKYNLNPDAFGVCGSSAGGHLVALLGTSGGEKDLEGDGGNQGVSTRVQAVCDFYGPTDFTRIGPPADPNGAVAKLLGGPLSEKKELVAKASPVTYVSKDDPPFLILHGDKDPLVPVSQSEQFHDALTKAGVDSTLVVVPGGVHSQRIGDGANADKIVAFFDKHLKKK